MIVTFEPLPNAAALGRWARQARKAQGLTLKALSQRTGLGIRFLSEFERGKDTAELGKALAALAALGLKMVPAPGPDPIPGPVGGNSLPAPGSSPTAKTPDAITASLTTTVSDRGLRPAAGGDAARLWDMAAAAGEVRELMRICGAEPALHQSTMLKRALERCVDVLGEAARRVTPRSQMRFPDIPWREIIKRRNELVMNYEHVDHETLLRAAQAELPGLEAKLQAALAALDTTVAGHTSVR